MKKPGKDTIKAGEVEIEVEDDTPEADRGRTASRTTRRRLQRGARKLLRKVKKRIKHFSKGYHDERRAKEAAQREREALEAYAQNLIAENEKLKSSVDRGHNSLIESAKKQVQNEITMAQRQYRDAYESGEPDAILEAQDCTKYRSNTFR
jgi:hypothetical protein